MSYNGLYNTGSRFPSFRGKKRTRFKVYFVLNGVVYTRFFSSAAEAAIFAANIRNRSDVTDTTRPIEV